MPNVAHQRGRDGIEVSARSTLAFTLRNLKLTRVSLYQDTEQALKAAGLGGPPREPGTRHWPRGQ